MRSLGKLKLLIILTVFIVAMPIIVAKIPIPHTSSCVSYVDAAKISSDSMKSKQVLSANDVSEELLREHLKKFGAFIVIDNDGTLYRSAKKVLSMYGIEIRRLDSFEELESIGCPKILVVNLDREAIATLTSETILDKLRRCSLSGTYVLFAFNDTKLADEVWRKIFGVPLPYKSNEVTVAKVWRSGKVEHVVEKTFFVYGRTYRVVDGKRIPIEVGGSAGYRDVKDLEKAISEALANLLKNIVYVELNLGNEQ